MSDPKAISVELALASLGAAMLAGTPDSVKNSEKYFLQWFEVNKKLLTDAQAADDKAAAELKAKQDADEAKAKEAARIKAEADVKAAQDAAIKHEADVKAAQLAAEAKAAAEAKPVGSPIVGSPIVASPQPSA
jgi:hypothetical protein